MRLTRELDSLSSFSATLMLTTPCSFVKWVLQPGTLLRSAGWTHNVSYLQRLSVTDIYCLLECSNYTTYDDATSTPDVLFHFAHWFQKIFWNFFWPCFPCWVTFDPPKSKGTQTAIYGGKYFLNFSIPLKYI